LLNCCAAILNGEAYSRSCGVLVDDADDLRFVRAGEHYLVFLDLPDEVVIVDILHSRSDLPRHVATLMTVKNKGC
jgi:plasmid stabilization system protein ParE